MFWRSEKSEHLNTHFVKGRDDFSERLQIRLSPVPLKTNAPEPDQWPYLPPFAPSRIC
jgi:hypothetical protein